MTSDFRPARPRLSSIVETYVRNRLPEDTHPAFKAIKDHDEASAAIAQITLNGEPSLDLAKQDKTSESGLTDHDDEDELAL